ncbi:MAG TPA: hypothetical protein VGS16_13695 [Candidatus Dormibacteraeota bacterium]|nr:hypothetical protein [Candidatus Dormibacteraeota bacterium]
MTAKRAITPDELACVFQLAATMPDLRVIPAQLAELATLRQRVTRGEAAMVAVRQSQFDLRDAMRRLAKAKGVTL